jgi:ribosomal protein L27
MFVALAAMGGAASAHAANAAAADDTAASEPKTLKERLGDKASDDQRVDNCKVPVAERGSKLRPDDCLHRRSAAN